MYRKMISFSATNAAMPSANPDFEWCCSVVVLRASFLQCTDVHIMLDKSGPTDFSNRKVMRERTAYHGNASVNKAEKIQL